MTVSRTEREGLLDRLAREWGPREIRELAASLLRLADSIDQQWDGSNSRSIFRWPSALARIERNAANLALRAQLLAKQRELRRDYIYPDLLAEPAWDMLLDLFMQYAGGAKISTTSLCIASQVPASTALRYVSALEEHGYVARCQSDIDKRVSLVRLTDKGVMAIGRYLERI